MQLKFYGSMFLLGVSVWLALLAVFSVTARLEMSQTIHAGIETANAALSDKVALTAAEASAQAALFAGASNDADEDDDRIRAALRSWLQDGSTQQQEELLQRTIRNILPVDADEIPTARLLGSSALSDLRREVHLALGLESLVTDVSEDNFSETSDIVQRKRGYERAARYVQYMQIHGESAYRRVGCVSNYLGALDSVRLEHALVDSRLGSFCGDNDAYMFEDNPGPTSDFEFALQAVYRALPDVSYLPTNALLAIAVIFSAGVGALSAELRRDRPATMVQFVVGTAGGFVAFLSIRGGSFLIVSPATLGNGGQIDLNPYGMALVGVLVGLFSDRAYALVSGLVDEASKRINPNADAGLAENTGNGGRNESPVTDDSGNAAGSATRQRGPDGRFMKQADDS